jgi:NitT/TauT family transport system permease protein
LRHGEVADGSKRTLTWARRGSRGLAYPLISIAALIGVWKLVQVALEMPAYLLPSPERVLRTAMEHQDLLTSNLLVTLREVVYGFAIAVILAVPLAVAMASWEVVERLVYPVAVAFQGLPKSAFAPLLVVWFGFGSLPKVLMVVLIAFFAIVVTTFVGLRSVQPELTTMGRSMGLSRLGLLRRIQLPSALPSMFGGFKIAITLAIVGAIVAEFVGAEGGLGYVIVVASAQLRTDLIFAALVYLGAMGIVLFALLDAVERLVIPWHAERQVQLTA